ncbi:MAG TPA: xanthine phosphoribosyltransferase [Thermotogota bacterium]|nr:xanthine phosphoribosyltransferase [Thermotogota bacterium]
MSDIKTLYKTVSTELKEKTLKEGKYLGSGILKVDSFINHQIYPEIMNHAGEFIAAYFAEYGITKVITIETSGIVPAYAAASALNVPLVFTRKKKPITMKKAFSESAPSHTKGGIVTLHLSQEMIAPTDNILIVDDFLASGKTIHALTKIIEQAGASLSGIVTVIEKTFEGGRHLLENHLSVPVIGLLRISSLNEEGIEFEEGMGVEF